MTPKRPDDGYSNDLSRVTTGAGLNLAGKVANGLIQYSYTIFVARTYGAELLGLLSLGLTITNIVGALSRLGLDIGVIRYVSLHHATADHQRVKGALFTALVTATITSFCLAIAVFYFRKNISEFFNAEALQPVLTALALAMPMNSLMIIALCATQGLGRMRDTVLAQNIMLPATNLGLAVILSLLGYGLPGLLGSYIIATGGATIISIIFLRKAFNHIAPIRGISEPSRILRFSITLVVAYFLNWLIIWTDTLTIGYFLGPDQVGIYNAANRTALLTGMILISFSGIFAPMISGLLANNDRKKLSTLLKTIFKWSHTISLPMCLVIALTSHEIMTIFGENFITGSNTLIVLGFMQMINSLSAILGWLVAFSGREALLAFNALVICITNALLNVYLVPRYGIFGAAVASTISIGLLTAALLYQCHTVIAITPFSKKLLRPSGIGFALFAILYSVKTSLFSPEPLITLTLYTIIFLGLFVTATYYLGLDADDNVLRNLITHKLTRKPVQPHGDQ